MGRQQEGRSADRSQSADHEVSSIRRSRPRQGPPHSRRVRQSREPRAGMPIPKSANGEMPFLDHLEELRWRIIYSLLALAVAVGIGFWLAVQYDAVGLLARPILPLIPEHKLAFLHPS